MACTNGWVDLNSSKPKIETCVATTSKDITVTVRGTAGEAWPFSGYSRVKLKRASSLTRDSVRFMRIYNVKQRNVPKRRFGNQLKKGIR
ncbi:hypothetical protein AEA09_18930 [Lysinibacillus contaminans]|uniref:Uncharacterized protein n=1 Tax=Lysinibacillus contaminans TaxID=1293441 RepID=A0ABR5JVW3_9BACI|nr:hypothetical protein [Lysinibacillus contaminans]KOS66290.1 hypothetical protein AEA09_18930 [Lysinibacillus contaminans]